MVAVYRPRDSSRRASEPRRRPRRRARRASLTSAGWAAGRPRRRRRRSVPPGPSVSPARPEDERAQAGEVVDVVHGVDLVADLAVAADGGDDAVSPPRPPEAAASSPASAATAIGGDRWRRAPAAAPGRARGRGPRQPAEDDELDAIGRHARLTERARNDTTPRSSSSCRNSASSSSSTAESAAGLGRRRGVGHDRVQQRTAAPVRSSCDGRRSRRPSCSPMAAWTCSGDRSSSAAGPSSGADRGQRPRGRPPPPAARPRPRVRPGHLEHVTHSVRPHPRRSPRVRTSTRSARRSSLPGQERARTLVE